MAEKARASRCLQAAVLAAIAGFLLAAGEAHAARPAIKDVTAAGLLGPPGAVHDTLLARRPAAPGSASYATPDGERVAVDVSAGYAETPARVQELVDFLGTLVHSHELGRLSVSIRTSDELHGICGFAADACYSPALMRMIIPARTFHMCRSSTCSRTSTAITCSRTSATSRGTPRAGVASGGRRTRTSAR